MKSWNVHAWYVTGILIALLIGSVSLQWDRVPGLPTVFSFALGLSSLLLAIIAIIQTLMSSGNVQGGLSSIKSAADEIKELAESISGLGGRVAATSEKLAEEISSLRQSETEGAQPEKDETRTGFASSNVPYGGAVAIYAAVSAVGTGKSFMMSDFKISEKLEDDIVFIAFQEGYLSSLITNDIIAGHTVDGRTIVKEIIGDRKHILEVLKRRKYGKLTEDYSRRLENIEKYFSGEID